MRTVLPLVLLLLAASAPAAPVPKVKPDGVILVVSCFDGVPARLLKPDGTMIRELPFKGPVICSLSPGGDRLAVCVEATPFKPSPRPGEKGELPTFNLHVVKSDLKDADQLGDPMATGFVSPTLVWAPDGKTIYVSTTKESMGDWGGDVTVCDLDTGKAEVEAKLNGFWLQAVSPDGKRLFGRKRPPTGDVGRWFGQLLDRTTLKVLAEDDDDMRFETLIGPDVLAGTRATEAVRAKKAVLGRESILYDVPTKSSTPLPKPNESDEKSSLPRGYPAPDGKRLLLLWTEPVMPPKDWPKEGNPARASRLTVADRDGKKQKTILTTSATPTMDEVKAATIYSVEWR